MVTGATGQLVDTVLDPGSWRAWDAPADDPVWAGPAYRAELRQARDRSGHDESVRTGEGSIHGHRVAVVLSEFDFLAGSIGITAGRRIVRAVQRATAEGLPLLAGPASGGTRMQEGTPAFVQMAAVTTALLGHRGAGLPFLVYLRHPTTGGVLASWGSLGHLTAAEPGALVGFLGPRVYRALKGADFPEGVQVAENLRDHGLIDEVLDPAELREVAGRILAVTSAPRRVASDAPTTPPDDADTAPVPAERLLQISRRAERPGVRTLLRLAAADVTVFHTTGSGERDEAMVVALSRLAGVPCVLVGQDRSRQHQQALHPAGLRAARRGMRLATELHLPLVTVIDTPGAELSRAAEEGGLAGEIARCLHDLLALPVPTVSVLLGEGAGGAALALFPADRTLAARHGWLSPLPPEGASAIVYRTTDRAAEMGDRQRIAAGHLRRLGVVDRVVPERPDAADEPAAFVRRVARAVREELGTLLDLPDEVRAAARAERWLDPVRTPGLLP